METPVRIIRALIEDMPGKRRLPREPKEQAVYDEILDAARTVFAHEGRHNVTMAKFAAGFGSTTATMRRYICDLDYLLSQVLILHLRAISRALGCVPADAPDIPAARRAAYLGATRNGLGSLTEAHLLLVRERHCLPPDLLDTIEQVRSGIGAMLASNGRADDGERALHLLDHPGFSPEWIEELLACPIPPPPPRRPVTVIEEEPGPLYTEFVAPPEARAEIAALYRASAERAERAEQAKAARASQAILPVE